MCVDNPEVIILHAGNQLVEAYRTRPYPNSRKSLLELHPEEYVPNGISVLDHIVQQTMTCDPAQVVFDEAHPHVQKLFRIFGEDKTRVIEVMRATSKLTSILINRSRTLDDLNPLNPFDLVIEGPERSVVEANIPYVTTAYELSMLCANMSAPGSIDQVHRFGHAGTQSTWIATSFINLESNPVITDQWIQNLRTAYQSAINICVMQGKNTSNREKDKFPKEHYNQELSFGVDLFKVADAFFVNSPILQALCRANSVYETDCAILEVSSIENDLAYRGHFESVLESMDHITEAIGQIIHREPERLNEIILSNASTSFLKNRLIDIATWGGDMIFITYQKIIADLTLEKANARIPKEGIDSITDLCSRLIPTFALIEIMHNYFPAFGITSQELTRFRSMFTGVISTSIDVVGRYPTQVTIMKHTAEQLLGYLEDRRVRDYTLEQSEIVNPGLRWFDKLNPQMQRFLSQVSEDVPFTLKMLRILPQPNLTLYLAEQPKGGGRRRK
jgi:hypothetical protein